MHAGSRNGSGEAAPMAIRTTIDDEPTPTAGASTRRRAGLDAGPVMIEARGVSKSFRIPEQRMDTVRERVTHPLTRPKFRELRALNDVSFDVHRGEFFGVVGRNGS